MQAAIIDAIFFDVGGVIVSSMFEVVAAYGYRNGLPRHRALGRLDPASRRQ